MTIEPTAPNTADQIEATLLAAGKSDPEMAFLHDAFVAGRESGEAQAVVDTGIRVAEAPEFTEELREKQAQIAAFFVIARDARVAEKTRNQIHAMCAALASNAAEEWIASLIEGEQTIQMLRAGTAERPIVMDIDQDFLERGMNAGYSIYPKLALEVLEDGDAGFAYFTYRMNWAPTYERRHKVSIVPSAYANAQEAAMVAACAFCETVEAEIAASRAVQQ